MIQDNQDDITKYLESITTNLHLITTSTSTEQHTEQLIDLVTHIFGQLCNTNITSFKDAVLKWQLQFLEGKFTDPTPVKLINPSENLTSQILQQLSAHYTKLTNAYQQHQRSCKKTLQYHEWMTPPPKDAKDIIRHANRRQLIGALDVIKSKAHRLTKTITNAIEGKPSLGAKPTLTNVTMVHYLLLFHPCLNLPALLYHSLQSNSLYLMPFSHFSNRDH